MKAILLNLLLFITCPILTGQALFRDSKFGINGLAKIDFYPSPISDFYSMIVDSNGRSIIVGLCGTAVNFAPNKIAICRFKSNGKPDSSFGLKGKKQYNLAGNTDCEERANCIISMPDGGFLIGGRSADVPGGNMNAALLRIDSSGNQVSNWGANGKIICDLGRSDEVMGIVIDEKKEILAICKSKSGDTTGFISLLKIHQNGSLDQTFGKKGVFEITKTKNVIINAVCKYDSSRFIAAGYFTDSLNHFLGRYYMDGRPDTSFGIAGLAKFPPLNGKIYDVKVDPFFNVIASGYIVSKTTDMAIFRFKANGCADSTLLPSGWRKYPVSNDFDISYSLCLTDSFYYLTGISYTNGSQAEAAILKLHKNGSTDNSFGAGGAWISHLSNRNDNSYQMAMDKMGRIYIGGTFFSSASMSSMMIMRLIGNGTAGSKFLKQGNEIILYPNPASNAIFLRDPEAKTGMKCTISLIDCYGKLIFSSSASFASGLVNVNLPNDVVSGMYVVQYQSANKNVQRTLLIQH